MKYSHNNEQQIIQRIIDTISTENTEYVDIGASDGVEMSNTLFLAQRQWNGLCVEYNTTKYNALLKNYASFNNIKFSNEKATPDTILGILDSKNINKKFTFLNLDIDGYDYFVLNTLLSQYKPSIICCEINEKIPPPIKFTVLYNDTYYWNDAPFFGQSISQVQELCKTHGYEIINVEYNNVFLVNADLSHKFITYTNNNDIKQIWKTGYLDKPDRKIKFSHNNGFEPIYNMTDDDVVSFINKAYIKHAGKYIISKG